jgi:hypothetical protein
MGALLLPTSAIQLATRARANPRLASIIGVRFPGDRGTLTAQSALWAAALALGVFLSLRDYQSYQVGFYQDDASYAVLTESLVRGPAYGYINEPGYPGPTRYPFGFPLILAPVALV